MTNPSSSRSFNCGLIALYACSGILALGYEVLWSKVLTLLFGVSTFGISVTVAMFMLGLGTGSFLGYRLATTLQHPLKTFALLEGGVALFGMGFVWLVQEMMPVLSVLGQDASVTVWYGLQTVISMIFLAPPTVAMGLGFAVILRAGDNAGGMTGTLYGFNTLGGAIGAMLPLWLLPAFGLKASVLVLSMLGLLVAWSAWILDRHNSDYLPTCQISPQKGRAGRWLPLLPYAGIGAAALVLEIGWVRLYGLAFLRTEYVLAIILAIYLMGIGLGSIAARQLDKGRRIHCLNFMPVLAVIFVLAGIWAFPLLVEWVNRHEADSLATAMVLDAAAIFLMTFPVTLLLGAWFPLLVRWQSSDESSSRYLGARWYGANAMGAGIGALLAGFVLIPYLGTPKTVVVAGFVMGLLGVYWATPRSRAVLAVGMCGLLLLVLFMTDLAEWPAPHRLSAALHTGDIEKFRYEDAVSITHVVERPDGQRLLLTDLQRMDASTDPNAVQTQRNQSRLPLSLKPEAESILFLGLGTGITASGTLFHKDLHRTAVELSQGAVQASRDWFAPVNEGVTENMKIIRDDARRYLLRSTERFDIIVGDVFHPDLAGRSTLLSVEQFERARNRLTSSGIFVQWLALNQFDIVTLKTVLRGFQRVFPNAMVFVDGFRMALVGAPRFILPPASRITDEARKIWLGRYWGQVRNLVDSEGPVESEWNPHVEYRLATLRYRLHSPLPELLDWLLNHRVGLDQAREQLGISTQRDIEARYYSTQLIYRSWWHQLRGEFMPAQRLLRLAHQANPDDPWIRGTYADQLFASLSQGLPEGMNRRQALMKILSVDPQHEDTLRALWHLEERLGHRNLAHQYQQALAKVSPLDAGLKAALKGVHLDPTMK
ncbi:MAG: spermine synthase [Gammaproteobacteria bacterium]|nr:MAG: spermine synthase [Gammaproteobacteria bacterium]